MTLGRVSLGKEQGVEEDVRCKVFGWVDTSLEAASGLTKEPSDVGPLAHTGWYELNIETITKPQS